MAFITAIGKQGRNLENPSCCPILIPNYLALNVVISRLWFFLFCLKFLNYTYLLMYGRRHTHVHIIYHDTHVEARGQVSGTGFLLLSYRSWGLNSGHQVLWQGSLSPEPSHHPLFYVLKQYLILQTKLDSNLQFSYPSLLYARNTGMRHCT